MIRGTVHNATEPRLEVVVVGQNGRRFTVEAQIDTGFTEFLTLDPSIVSVLQLPYEYRAWLSFGSAGRERLSVYRARVLWGRSERGILVHASPGVSLVGMGLLYGSRLIIDVTEGGAVSIRPIPRRRSV